MNWQVCETGACSGKTGCGKAGLARFFCCLSLLNVTMVARHSIRLAKKSPVKSTGLL
jgi:hypothetical protein